jgi:REP element-mobilizing transposase RayT
MKQFKLYAFCILTDHIHLLLEPGEKYNISKVMKSLKENFSRDANKLLDYHPYESSVSDTSTCRICVREYLKTNQQRIKTIHFEWQKSYHHHIIGDDKDFENHYDYTVENYLKHHTHGYPDNYKYTSLNYPDLVENIEF